MQSQRDLIYPRYRFFDVLSLEEESLRNEKGKRWISENPRFTSYHTHTHTYTYIRTQSHVCTSSHAIAASVDVRARDCQESQEETNEKRTVGARQLCTSRLGSGLHLYPHTSCLVLGEPRGPMRQYVPIIFRLVLFHSLARSAKAALHPPSTDHGSAISPKLSV